MFLEARRIKTVDEIGLLAQACSMVDAAYDELYVFLRPGVRENECVGLVSKVLYDLGSEYVEGVNAISGERCSPHPHVYSDRIVRPGDPAFFDILHSHMGYRTCYYRCFAVGSASPAMRDAYVRCREYMDLAIAASRPGATTADIVSLWPTAEEFGFANEEAAFALQYGHGVGLAIWEKPIFSRLVSLDHPEVLEEGMVFALETYWPGVGRLVSGPDRGGGRGHGRRLRGDHQVPRRGAVDRGPALLDRGWRAAVAARVAVPSEHECRQGRAVTVSAGASVTVDASRLLEWYEQMALIRRTEKAAYDLFMSGEVKGTTHLAAGQEAVAVGASAALREDDYVFATYRGHHHAMARGATPAECLAELMSKATGLCKAKGGSMHLTKADKGMLGSYAIVGSHLPIAAGAAWSAKLRGSEQVAVAFFGDGATNIGAFHEALNLAAVWKLPVLFVCENNLYMEYTPIASVTSVANPAADRAVAYGLPAEIVDGNDVVAVHDTMRVAVDRARAGDGPTVIEAQTYRHYGHSRADPAKYRPADEVERWMARDPLKVTHDRLISWVSTQPTSMGPMPGSHGLSRRPCKRPGMRRSRIRPRHSPTFGRTVVRHGGIDHLSPGRLRGNRARDAS